MRPTNGIVLLAMILAACGVDEVPAQPEAPRPGTLIGEEKRTRDELEVADRLAADKQYDDAIRRYRQILADSGDALVSLDPKEPRRALPARWLVHRRIAALPPEGRRIFRAAVEDAARKWLEQAAASRDVRLLEQVVAEAFCTPAAEQALHLLGDLALERGEFAVAEHYWRMLAIYPSEAGRKPTDDASAFQLVHPEPTSDGALARAKLLMALIFRGEKQRAREELRHFIKLHAEATGTLAGHRGKFAETLQTLAEADVRRASSAGPIGDPRWPTFAGDSSRNAPLTEATTPYWPDVRTWSAALPRDPKAKPHRDSDPPLGTGSSARGLAFHPVIVAGHVLIADAARVFAYDLGTGKLVAEYDHRTNAGLPDSLDLRLPSRTDARYTLSVSGDRVYARFGLQPVKWPDNAASGRDRESVIVCLAFKSAPAGKVELQYRWQIRARPLDTDPNSMFEGAPLVSEGRLYVARTRFEGQQLISSIECYDEPVGERGEAPPRRWRQDVWSVEAPTETVRHRHELLTRAGPNVVFCTHSGVVIALDAASGKRAWAYRYPAATHRPPDGVHPRDLCPCLHAGGRVYAAPTDSDRIYCLDARSGQLVWESKPTHVVHLLGLAGGRLIATLGGFPHGIRAYDASRGLELWTRPDEGDLATFGRGLLSERHVFWPTRGGFRVLRIEDGDAVDAGSNSEPWGNLCLGEGHLIVATPTELWGFVPPRAGLARRRLDADTSAEGLYNLALAEADAGEVERALMHFRQASERAADGERLYGLPLRDLANRRRFELLEARAVQLWKDDQKAECMAILRRLSAEPFSLTDRVRAWTLRRLAGDLALPDLIDQLDVRSLWVTRPDGMQVRADEFLIGLLGEAERTKIQGRIRKTALAEAEQFDREGKHREAAERFRLLMQVSRWDVDHARALDDRRTATEGLIRIYEKGSHGDAARALRRRLERELASSKPVRPAREPPVVIRTPNVGIPWGEPISVPLSPGHESPLTSFRDAATGEEGPSIVEGRIFFAGSRRVTCRSGESGQVVWTRAIAHEAGAFAPLADSVVVAGPLGITRLRITDGQMVWQFLTADPRPMPETFPDYSLRLLETWSRADSYSAFRQAGSRLIVRQRSRHLLALDAETGQVLWRFRSPTEANICEHLLVTADHVLLQAGGEMMVLDALDGRMIHRRPAPTPWPGPPILIDGGRAVYADGPHLHALELDTFNVEWSYAPHGPSSLTGASPQIRADGSRLLALYERNYGHELVRLRLDSGKADLGPIFLSREHIDLWRSALAPEVYAVLIANEVMAIDRDDGRVRWSHSLNRRLDETWRARATQDAVLVHTESARPVANLHLSLNRAQGLAMGFPTTRGAQRALALAANVFFRRSFPVQALDLRSGRVLQQAGFPAHGPFGALLLGTPMIVAVEGRIELLRRRQNP